MTARQQNHGFTLVEMMATLIISAILLAMAVPSFRTFIVDQRVKGATLELMGALRFARSEAVKRNAAVSVVAADGGWSAGWEVRDGDGAARSGKTLSGGSVGVNEAGGQTSLAFNGQGRLAANAFFTLCSAGNAEPARRRLLRITSSGMPDVQLNGVCTDAD